MSKRASAQAQNDGTTQKRIDRSNDKKGVRYYQRELSQIRKACHVRYIATIMKKREDKDSSMRAHNFW
jgi:hypothetical protein